jgi:hypothetical protein
LATQQDFACFRFLNNPLRPLPAQTGLKDMRTAKVATVMQRIQYGKRFDMSQYRAGACRERIELPNHFQDMLVA